MKHISTLFLLSILCSGCGANPSSVTSETTTIEMVKNGFSPDPITVYKGQQVCWVNKDTDGRWPASNIHPTHEIYSEFDPTKPILVGETWCFTFDKAGIWKYHDHLLPEFVGTVNVE